MAQEQVASPNKATWTKIFSGFKVALDLKKMALAAAGILAVFLGWWLLSWVFYNMRSLPVWTEYESLRDNKKDAWTYFKAKRNSWNLLHELAGSPNDRRKIDAADLATNVEDFELLNRWEDGFRKNSESIEVRVNKTDGTYSVYISGKGFSLQLAIDDVKNEPDVLALAERKNLTTNSLRFGTKNKAEESKTLYIEKVKFDATGKVEEIRKYREEALDRDQIKAEGKLKPELLELFESDLINPKYKPSGRLNTPPFSEDRGENPYLIVANGLKSRGDSLGFGGDFLNWLVYEQGPVVLEPLVKLLLPLVYLFDSRAGGWDRLYLCLAILWMLAVWGFFGGAICRIAAVQIARNERITLGEAIAFTRERCISYFAAPVIPLVLVAILTFCLIVFGWFEWIPWFGDVIVAGLFWPIVLLLGFIMTIVLVGMIGWPLMVATISTEGSDSFDALSRSYSYVYQAPWRFVWYGLLAVAYGAVLIFFVGFMASLMVFVGKWGVSSAPGLASENMQKDREPSYLFYHAPTSFGWRDLLISSSQFVEPETRTTPSGRTVTRLDFKTEYKNAMTPLNHTGAWMVTIWLWLVFLLVLGFGYSYFWTASTLIYFLLRQDVDDTEMNEVHLEDEEMGDPFARSAPTTSPLVPPTAPTPQPSKPGTLSLNVVDAPPSTAITPAPPPTPEPPVVPASTPTSEPAMDTPPPPRDDERPASPPSVS
jgi:hypothetical protein